METATSDVATETSYDGANHTVLVQADEPGGGYQQTQFVYGVTTTGGSGVTSNDVMAATKHPDPATGAPSASQQETYTTDAQGEVVTATDRNGTVHTYTRDVLGRVISDAITTLGSGVDGGVRRIETAYDTQGNAYLVTSFDAATGGTIVSQVLRQFDGLGQLTAEYQSNGGAVDTSTTPKVQYAYSEMAGGANHNRLTSITYPGGYVVNYNYGSTGSLNDTISRLESLSDGGGTLEAYKYLGLSMVVERSHPQPGVNLTYLSQTSSTGDAGDKYTGLDRFGRVAEQNWYNTGTSASVSDYGYGHDRNGNVLYRQDLVNAVFSELYQYDPLNQLANFQRGTLNGTKTGLTGSASRSQSWTTDALGNFTGVTTDGTAQSQTFNQQNEMTSGGATYDANGNMTADGSGNTFVYDAWNRLVAVKNSGGTVIAGYGYDGLGRRASETHGSTTRDLYYSAQWQVLEERVGGTVQARNVWSPVYVDALVLRDQSSAGDGTLDQRLYAVQDANFNVVALVNTSGTVVERYAYDPYGVVTVMAPDGTGRSASAYDWGYLRQGTRRDWVTGADDSRGRVHSPALGRPLQADPQGLGPDINDYRWEANNPRNATDPSGRDPVCGMAPWPADIDLPRSPAWLDFHKTPTDPNGVLAYPGSQAMEAIGFERYEYPLLPFYYGETFLYRQFEMGCVGLNRIRLGTEGPQANLPGTRAFVTLDAALAAQKAMIAETSIRSQVVLWALQIPVPQSDLKDFPRKPESVDEYKMPDIKRAVTLPAKPGFPDVYDYLTAFQTADLKIKYWEDMPYGATKNPHLIVTHIKKLSDEATVYFVVRIRQHHRAPEGPCGLAK